jgi:hypothetical protein
MPHPNADRLAIGYVCNETVVVGKDTPDGALGIYFPCDLQLSEQFAQANDLIRRKNSDGTTAGGFFEENRRVRVQKIRGVESHGFWCPIEYLASFGDVTTLTEGQQLDSFNGVPLCNKYRSKSNQRSTQQAKVKRVDETCFPKHKDTPQWKHNLDKIGDDVSVVLTLKMHGTSQRTGKVLVERPLTYWEKWLEWLGFTINTRQLTIINGTRNTVITDKEGFHSNDMRMQAASKIIPFLEEHMIVYYEIVGYEPSGKPIMATHDGTKLNPCKSGTYSSTITYSYGCEVGEHDVYVYRIVYVLPNGKTIDLPWDEVVKKCNAWNVKHVPEFARMSGATDVVAKYVEQYSEGSDPIDSRHPREGVCVRVDASLDWETYKCKGYTFKYLEGIMKEDEYYRDVEEEA